MRVAPCLIVAASVCLGLVGCSLTNRRQNGNSGGPFLGAGPQANNRKAEPIDPLSSSAGMARPELDGMLAGQVLDAFNGKPVSATIRCVCLDDPKARENDRGEAATDAHGNYIIQGLKAGKQYKLIAKAKADGRALIGVKYTQAPNPRAVIKLQEDTSKSSDEGAPPPAPPPAGKPAESEPKKSAALPSPQQRASAQSPGWAPSVGTLQIPNPGGPGAGNQAPVPLVPQQSPAAGGRPPWDRPPPRIGAAPAPERIAKDNSQPWQPPTIEIKNKPLAPVPEVPLSPDQVPSCTLVGKQLVNFALYDLKLQPWEYRKHKRGKLVLLDFWSTSCLPCLQSLPSLTWLKDRYGPYGLEVVGIAYEDPNVPPAEQARRVAATAQARKINYTLLLGGGPKCPVRTQFGVRHYPTLVLVSENGWIVWAHEGLLQPRDLPELERRIRQWLGTN